MRLHSKDFIILTVMIFIVCGTGGLKLPQTADAKNKLNPSQLTSVNYSVNEQGQTVGSIEKTNSVEMLPDLIHVGSVKGITGYVMKKDYLGETARNVPLFDIDGKTIIGSFPISPKITNYPKNINGQTYGSAADATSPETEPELISAAGMDGTEGYVLKKDLDGEQPKTPEEAIHMQNSISPDGFDIPLYDIDGETVIGVFHVGGM